MLSKVSLAGLLQALSVLNIVTATPLIRRNSPSCNTPQNRACWADGFNVHTDWEEKTPLTGCIKNSPTITADWGDWINVTVINKLPANGTSIHWHGIRMLNNNIHDGVNGVTECPIPPNGTKSYVFRAQQYGTTWYHSHHSSQYGNGVWGPLVINGPASANYDVDLGTFPINDWYYDSADRILSRLQALNGGAPPASDNIFFNGTNVNRTDITKGKYAKVVLTPGLTHRLRLINPSVDYTFTFSIVGHNFTVISNDLVPLNTTSPNTTVSSIFMGIGQRYDIIIQGKSEEEIAGDPGNGNYWINATQPTNGVCGNSQNKRPAAILSYDYPNATDQLPILDGPDPVNLRCEDTTDFRPVVARDIPRSEFNISPSNTLSVNLLRDTNRSQVFWTVNNTDLNVMWEKPILEFVREGNTSWPDNENLLEIPSGSHWSFWLIENELNVPHPLHLHGHDFVVVSRSPALDDSVLNDAMTPVRHFDPVRDAPGMGNFTNPTRRDATMLPGKGWLIVAFRNDNPGAWLFHCHIAWHASMGLSVQFLERKNEIKDVMDLDFIEDNCKAWQSYIDTNPPWQPKNDSGI
ncbi:multicopper oxidase-domain-containing protein [Copromyces sp. CBS 386.78]|nr:multicopper oxidase-domain-containing protein [Copromyces sp. CBS 386.78]